MRGTLPQVTNKKQTYFTFTWFFTIKSHNKTIKQTTNKAFRNKNLKTKRGRWMEGGREEEKEEWLVTFGTVLAVAVLWVTRYFLFLLITFFSFFFYRLVFFFGPVSDSFLRL